MFYKRLPRVASRLFLYALREALPKLNIAQLLYIESVDAIKLKALKAW